VEEISGTIESIDRTVPMNDKLYFGKWRKMVAVPINWHDSNVRSAA
jgi:hypothetical protein